MLFTAATGESYQGECKHEVKVRGVVTAPDGGQSLHDFTHARPRIDPSPRVPVHHASMSHRQQRPSRHT